MTEMFVFIAYLLFMVGIGIFFLLMPFPNRI